MALPLSGQAAGCRPLAGAAERAPSEASAASQRRKCRHCGSPLKDEAARKSGYCCPGCTYVHRLITEGGWQAYYRIKDPVTPPADVAVFEPRDYGWLAEAQSRAEAGAPGTAHLELSIQGVSCAGCVWLIERVSSSVPGLRSAEVEPALGSVRLRWTPGPFSAPDWARRLQRFGYLVGPAGDQPERLESTALARRIGLCAAFALNVMLFTLPSYFGMRPDFAYAPLFRLLALGFATLSVLVGGTYFFSRAAGALRARAAHIDLPIAIGIAGAYAGSVYGWLVGAGRLMYFDFVATFTVLMLVGRWAQIRAVERNRLRLLRRQPIPPRIHLETGESVARETLRAGQSIRIGPGQTVPVDAQLECGAGLFSLASICGESEARRVDAGGRVPGGAVNVGRSEARLRTLQTWDNSFMARLLAPAARRASGSAALQRLIQAYVAGIIGLSFAGGLAWWLIGRNPARAAEVAIAVLVVACPCAVGLALPFAEELASGAARARGVYVRDSGLWCRLRGVSTIAFDKTGTLTLEAPVLEHPEALAQLDEAARAALAAMVRDSLHPVSQCLWENLLATGDVQPQDGRVAEEPGSGVALGPWTLGRAGWADDGAPGSDTVLAYAGQERARFAFTDRLRPGAAQELAALRRMGFRLALVSGDSPEKVAAIAAEVGCDPACAHGGLTAEGKAAWVEREGAGRVLMLGDGANDSLAFDAAQCRGTPVVHRGILEAKADFYYLRRGVDGIRGLLEVGRALRRTEAAVIGFSVAYNALAAGFALSGRISPLAAAVLMPASSLASLLMVGIGMRSIMQDPDASR